MRRCLFALTAVLVLAFAACAGSDEADDATVDEITESTWDVVILSDSYLTNVAETYAEHVAEANDVEVVLHNESTGLLSVMSLSEELAADEGRWPDLVREAEVVVFWGNPEGLIPEGQEGNCGNGGRTIEESHCDGDWDPYREGLEQIAVDIKRLRDGQPTIIRTMQGYSPGVGQWEEAGVYDDCMACETYAHEAEQAAADAQGVPIAQVWDEFNGPDHTEDPVEKGYIASDGFHPSLEGAYVIACLLYTSPSPRDLVGNLVFRLVR